MEKTLTSTLALLAALSISGCSAEEQPGAPEPEKPREHVFCALDGAEQFTSDCTLERSRAGEGEVLVVHHPDGGFRRFTLGRDPAGLVTADGADQARPAPNGALLDVRVGRDRYRFPLEEPVPDAAAQ